MNYYCKQCGAMLPEGAQSCPVCSTPFALPEGADIPDSRPNPDAAPEGQEAPCPPAADESSPVGAAPGEPSQGENGPEAPLLQNAWAPGDTPKAPQPPHPEQGRAEQPHLPRYASHAPARGPRPRAGARPAGCELTTGQYFVTLLILAIPLVGLIMGFIWAFGGGTEEARRRLARAYLLRTAVFVAVLLVLALLLTLLAALFYQLAYGYYNPYYYRGYFS